VFQGWKKLTHYPISELSALACGHKYGERSSENLENRVRHKACIIAADQAPDLELPVVERRINFKSQYRDNVLQPKAGSGRREGLPPRHNTR